MTNPSISFVGLNKDTVCTKGSTCEGFTLNGDYQILTSESGDHSLSIKTLLTAPNKNIYKGDYFSSIAIEYAPN